VVEAPPPEPEAPQELVDALREWRLGEARKWNVPSFCIFHNRTLQALARLRPTNEEGLLQVKGIGPKLIEKHGDEILDVIRRYEEIASD
jgi:superfamily II DNA helicase RecQ